jgi:GH35 family endo-1,4-beta-xylanase
MLRIALIAVLCASIAPPTWALSGSALSLNSGTSAGAAAQLDDNGYAGTYITLAAQGNVKVTVNAAGTSFGGVDPHMNIVIADTTAGFDVSPSGSNPYVHEFQNLPAGTYFVRTEFDNDGGSSRALTINNFDVDGATIDNSTGDTDLRAISLAAADTYIDNFRKGPGKVGLVGIAPGTQVGVKLKNHAFNFGTNIHGFGDSGLINPNPTPGSTADKYQQFVTANFNMVEGSNAGKWTANENTRDNVSIAWQDKIFDFAEAHNMRARLHAMVWGNQQPNWVTNLLSDATGTDTYNAASNSQGTNLNNLDAFYSDLVAPAGTPSAGEPSEVQERINYYVGDGVGSDRATRYSELDVYNESYHTGVNGGSSSIWNRFGPEGVARIYDDVANAVDLAGANVRLYLNEYSVLQNQGGDAYANWYREHIEAVENADGDPFDQTVSGIGVQYYVDNGHSTDLMMKSLQNLSVLDLPITLTEFGVQGSVTSDADRIRIMNESHRMLFGTPNATGFLYWGWWASATSQNLQGGGLLVDANFNLTPVGEAWKTLRDSWTTDLTATVSADGTIDFAGFYGDYELTIDGQTYDLALAKGDSHYSIVIAPGDYNADGTVNAADYVVWRNTLGSVDDLRADGNGDEMIDAGDYDIWKSLFGTVYGSGAGSIANVPEPASVVILLAGICLAGCRRQRKFSDQDGRAN